MSQRYIYVAHVEPHRMPGQHTVYYNEGEEELQEWVEQYEDVLGGRSDFLKRCVRLARKEYGDEIESLAGEGEGRDKLV